MKDFTSTQMMMHRQSPAKDSKQLTEQSQVDIADDEGATQDIMRIQDSELIYRDSYCFFR
jgi:hypothetical protein